MAKKKNKTIIGISLAIGIIVLLLFSFYSQSFSVLNTSTVQLGNDGRPYWIFFLKPSGSGEQINFYSPSPDNMEAYTDLNGGTYVPQYDFSLSLEPESIICEYPLTEGKDILDTASDLLTFWKEDHDYYKVGNDPKRSAPIKITSSKSTEEKYIDGFNIGESITFEDQRDEKGNIIVEVQGGLVGNYDCKSPTEGMVVAIGKNTGEDSYYSGRTTSIGNSLSISMRDQITDWERDFDCQVDKNANKLICKRSDDSLFNMGSGTLTVTADADYLDYRYYPPTQGLPKLVSVISDAEIKKNTYGSAITEIKNIGDQSGVFIIYGESEKLNILPSSKTISLGSGETKQLSFSLIAPVVEEAENIDGTFSVCNTGQFSSNKCDEKSFSVKVTTKTPDTNFCGDGYCSITETSTSCPSDCDENIVCNGNHMYLQYGECLCEEGYFMEKDDFGREYCKEKTDSLILIIGVFIVIILMMITIKLKSNNGGKK